MSALLKPCYSLFLSMSSWLDKTCQANPKYTQNSTEQEVAKTRNKAIFIIHIVLLILYVSDIFVNGAPVIDCLFRAFLVVGILGSLLLSCRYHPEIFGMTYAIICIIYGPGIMDSGSEGIHAAWVAASLLPMFQFLFTGSFWHFLVQALFQFYYLNVLYPSRMQKAVQDMRPESYTLALKQAFALVFIVQGLIIVMIHYSMNQAYNRVRVSEKKKAEIENQKTFLLSFSHELRNLINSLAGNVKLASLEVNLSQRTKELLLNAEVCGELLLHLVNNILDTGKVEIGELEINPAPSKIYDTCERIWGICSELIRRKDLRGCMKIQNNLPKTLMIDHYRLMQIFLNIVGNAVKFTDKGSVNITVEWMSDHSEVTEECFKPFPFNEDDDQDEGMFEKAQDFKVFDDNFLTLDTYNRRIKTTNLKASSSSHRGVLKIIITDTGCGMNKHERDQLFQKFTQVNADASKRKLGTGLGLFISKQLCQRMNGEVRVFSAKEKGSCFIVCLPVDTVRDENEHLRDTESLKAIISAKNLTAMIVDDAPFNHLILTNFFEKLGIRVTDIAANGLEAVQKYSQRARNGDRPHIVAMDLDMPIMDGKQASQKIREFEAVQGLIPCFLGIVSGNCSESEITECMNKHGQVKADTFLKKPTTIEELLRAIGYHFVNE